MRHIIMESRDGGSWYVYDTVKGQLVWKHANKGLAEEMAADLNNISSRSYGLNEVGEAAARVAEEAVSIERSMALRQKRVEDLFYLSGDPEGAAWLEKDVREGRQRAADLRCLLAAVGFASA